MLRQEDRIRLIHDNRTVLLNRMFDELCLKSPGSSAEQLCDKIITTARVLQNALSNADDVHPARGLFVLALQQVVDSFLAGLLTDEAFEWLAEEQRRVDDSLLEGIDPI
jgi:hypothetical protein